MHVVKLWRNHYLSFLRLHCEHMGNEQKLDSIQDKCFFLFCLGQHAALNCSHDQSVIGIQQSHKIHALTENIYI